MLAYGILGKSGTTTLEESLIGLTAHLPELKQVVPSIYSSSTTVCPTARLRSDLDGLGHLKKGWIVLGTTMEIVLLCYRAADCQALT